MALDHVCVGDVAAPAARLARHQRHARVAVVPAGRERRGVGLDINKYFFLITTYKYFYILPTLYVYASCSGSVISKKM